MIKEELLETGKLFLDGNSERGTIREAHEKRASFKETMGTKELNELFEEETKIMMGSLKENQISTGSKRPGTTGVGARPRKSLR